MFKFLKGNNQKTMLAPCDGEVVSIEEVADPVFAQKMVGDGFAIIPSSEDIYSPVEGEILQVFPSHHAVCIKSVDGLEIIVHVGLDTVELKGEGFSCHTKVGDSVKAGDKLLSFSLEVLKAHDKNPITPVVITNQEIIKKLTLKAGPAKTGQVAVELTLD